MYSCIYICIHVYLPVFCFLFSATGARQRPHLDSTVSSFTTYRVGPYAFRCSLYTSLAHFRCCVFLPTPPMRLFFFSAIEARQHGQLRSTVSPSPTSRVDPYIFRCSLYTSLAHLGCCVFAPTSPMRLFFFSGEPV